jgi:hypothetical protein
VWQALTCQLGDTFIMPLACRRGTQEAHVTALIHHEPVVDRVALRLATLMVLLFLGVFWAVDWSFRTIRPNRGEVGTSLGWLRARRGANSAAVRAGSRSCCAKACFNTVWRR